MKPVCMCMCVQQVHVLVETEARKRFEQEKLDAGAARGSSDSE